MTCSRVFKDVRDKAQIQQKLAPSLSSLQATILSFFEFHELREVGNIVDISVKPSLQCTDIQLSDALKFVIIWSSASSDGQSPSGHMIY